MQVQEDAWGNTYCFVHFKDCVNLGFDGCSLGNQGQLGIGGGLGDHHIAMVKAFSKPASKDCYSD